jgi:hypothetical protein
MVKYLVVHNKHEGCYDFPYFQDEVARIRITSITINPPKIYMFNTRDEAQDFFEEYINDVDCIDNRCKKGEDVEHIDYCTCGVIEIDEEENPILFYNRKNQIFLLEHGPQLFVPPAELKNDIKNLNLTNRLIRKCRTLTREQRNRYIDLGKYCQDCNSEEPKDDTKSEETKKEPEKLTSNPIPIFQITIPAVSLTKTEPQQEIKQEIKQEVKQEVKEEVETKKPKVVRKKKEKEDNPDSEKKPKTVKKKKDEPENK